MQGGGSTDKQGAFGALKGAGGRGGLGGVRDGLLEQPQTSQRPGVLDGDRLVRGVRVPGWRSSMEKLPRS